jgi:hypothetical protein
VTSIALVETAAQAEALDTPTTLPARPAVLSLLPEAGLALGRRGLSYWSLRDVIAPAEVDAVATDQMARLEEAVAAIDRALENAGVPGVAEMMTKPTALAWSELKTLLNSVGLRLNVLARLHEQGVRRVIAFAPLPAPEDAPLLSGPSLWGRVLRAAATEGAFDLTWLSLPAAPPPPPSALRWLAAVLPDQIRWHGGAVLRAARFIGWSSAITPARHPRLASGSMPPVVLFLSAGSNLPPVIDAALASSCVRPAFPIGLRPRAFEVWHQRRSGAWSRTIHPVGLDERTEAARAVTRAWEALCASAAFRRLWDERGLAGFPAMAGFLRAFVTRTSLDLIDVWRTTTRGLEALHIRAVLAEVTGTGPVKAVMAAARQAGIPVLVYRHGVSLGYMTMEYGVAPEEYRNDVLFADRLLCWGDLDVEFFQRWHGTPAVAVGSTHLDGLRRLQRSPAAATLRAQVRQRLDIPAGTRCAVYVLQNLAGNAIATPRRYRLPDVEWTIERAIIEAFRDFTDVTLVVRLHPDPAYPEPPVSRLVRDLGMINVRVVREGSMAELLAAGDLFITDYPTTAFLEMLTTDKPVLVCGQDLPPGFAPGPAVQPLWSERVLFRPDLAGFLDMLRSVLVDGVTVPPPAGDGLLKNFGTHRDDGASALRVLAALKAVVA